MTAFDYIIGWTIGVIMFTVLARFLTDLWPWEFGQLRKKRKRCHYPNCDGGPATGYCHADCRQELKP